MKILLTGATGMVGQGVLRECLLAADVEQVISLGRAPLGQTHAKLRDLVHKDLYDLAPIAKDLEGIDACLFCLGVSAAGMSEADYTKITYDLTLSVAKALLAASPKATFIYVSGESTDSTEKGSAMWARVKGRTENAILKLGFPKAFAFRPGYIQPLHGIKSRTFWYRVIYGVFGPFYPLLKKMAPKMVTNTEEVGRAMLRVVREGFGKPVVHTVDIGVLGGPREQER